MVTYANRGGDAHRTATTAASRFRPERRTYTHGQWATVRVEVETNQVSVFFNGQLMIRRAIAAPPAVRGLRHRRGHRRGRQPAPGAQRPHRARRRHRADRGGAPTRAGRSPAAELIQNGGFEAPAFNRGHWQPVPSIPGWRLLSGPGIEVQHLVAGSPAEGRQHIELDSHASSAIGQDLRTQPGTIYQVSFAFAARPGTAQATNGLEVRWNGQLLGRLTADGRGARDTQWTRATYFVRANSPTSRLSFHDVGRSDSTGTYLDAVSVRVAP